MMRVHELCCTSSHVLTKDAAIPANSLISSSTSGGKCLASDGCQVHLLSHGRLHQVEASISSSSSHGSQSREGEVVHALHALSVAPSDTEAARGQGLLTAMLAGPVLRVARLGAKMATGDSEMVPLSVPDGMIAEPEGRRWLAVTWKPVSKGSEDKTGILAVVSQAR